MTLKTSLIITGDASVAKKEVDNLNAAVASLASGAKSAAAPIAQVDQAQQQAAASAREGAAAAQQLVAANEQVAASTGAAGKQIADIHVAQTGAAIGATAHANAAKGLQGELTTMIAQIAGGSSVFQAMADRGGAFAAALAAVAQASAGAGDSGEQASIDLGGLGDTVLDVAGRAEGMEGRLGSVAAFLGGPWGAAVGIGINLLGGFVAGLIQGALESDELSSSSLTLVDALSKEKFATDAAREAIEAYNDQQKKARDNNDLAHRDALRKAQDDIAEALNTRRKTQALIEQAKAQLQTAISDEIINSPGFNPEGGALSAAVAGGRVAEIQRQLDDNKKLIADLEQTLRNKLIEVGRQDGEAAVDRIKAIDLKYNLQRQQAEAAAASNTKLARTIDDTVAAIERRRAADKKAYEESQRRATAKPKGDSLGNQIEVNSAAAILATAERYRGLSENRGGDVAQLRELFKQGEMGKVDPTITAWCAAFVNSVLAATGIKGNGSLSARSFLGYGQSTDSPNKGDIVVSKRGDNAAQGHVGFYQGTDAKGRVLVLGGNTGDKVATQAVARSDVLGFRRAPTAADAYNDSQKAAVDAQKAADDAAKAQQRALDQVIAKYLPATAAAKDYANELARINALAASYDEKDAASGLTPEQADAARAALKAANDKRVADLNMTPEAKAAADAKKSIDGVIASLGQELAVRQAANPVEAAMIAHRKELAALAKTDPGAAATREAELRAAVAQDEAYRGVEQATRAAAEAQRQFRDMALDAFDAIVLGGQNAGKVIDRLGQTIASAAIEAAVLGTGPLAALLKGGVAAGAGAGTPPVAPSAGGAAAQATADVLGKTVSKSLGDRLDSVFGKGNGGKALQNAGFGYTAASLTGGSGIGGALGGAVGGQLAGKFLSSALGSLGGIAGPLGSIVGGVLGGVVGKLFAAAPKYGTASVTGDSVGVTGNGGAAKAAANSLAGAVQSGVAQIAEKLGGELGKYAVSIGTFDGKYRVSTTGFTGSLDSKKAKGQGLMDFGKEGEGAAIAYAIADAVKDGAVKGLSAAVTKAIQSSTDINAALAEALKVQDLELLVGGVNAQIDKAFRDFEAQAKERVRLATTYGFDVVAIEKRNGEDRAKLAEQLASQQVGSLQKLIGEITQGSLFEGSALDRITALNTSIAKAKTDLDAGVDGAADTLADLYGKRLAASKEAYGATSGYAADRTATLDAARAAVAAANARIVAAQATPTSDPALATTNATLDEISEQSARTTAAIDAGFGRLSSQIAAGGGTWFDLASLAAV